MALMAVSWGGSGHCAVFRSFGANTTGAPEVIFHCFLNVSFAMASSEAACTPFDVKYTILYNSAMMDKLDRVYDDLAFPRQQRRCVFPQCHGCNLLVISV